MQDSRAPSPQQPPSPEATILGSVVPRSKEVEWLPPLLGSQAGLLGTQRSLRRKRVAAGSQVEVQIWNLHSYSFFPAPLGLHGVYTEVSSGLLPRHSCEHQQDSSKSWIVGWNRDRSV